MIFYFVILFGFVFCFAGLYVAWKGHTARQWPSTNGKVLISEVRKEIFKRQRGPNTVHYKPYVEYVFEVGGREYQSKAISSSGHVKFSREKAANVLKRFEKGSEVEVKYDPNAPHDSYLIAGVGPGVWAGVVFGISLIVLGVLGIVNGW